MVDLGQKKVDSYPPFFMFKNEHKKNSPGRPGEFLYCNIVNCYSIAFRYLAVTSFQSITLKNALM